MKRNYFLNSKLNKFLNFYLILNILPSAIFLLFSFEGCKSPTGPQTESRDYIWTVDTIKTMDPLTLSRIWGISPSDVWAVGSGAATALGIWHYDGNRWDCDSISRGFTPWAVIGFSRDEVWIGNTSSTIWKYNGFQWLQYGQYNLPGYDQVVIQNFDGLSGSDIYGVGYAAAHSSNIYKGIIMHYNGQKWNFVNIPSTKVSFEDCKIDQISGALIIAGTVYDSTGWISKLYVWDGSQLKEIYSGIPFGDVGSVGKEVLMDIDQKIYKYENGQLDLWKDLSGSAYGGKIWCGRNENDFFIGTFTGKGIAHYNGTDFQTIYKFKSELDIYGGYIFDNDVFFLLKAINGSGDNYILHGKLN